MNSIPTVMLAAFIVVASHPPVHADEFARARPPRPDDVADALAEVVAECDAGTEVRILLDDGRLLQGRHAGSAPGRLFLADTAGHLSVPLDDVMSLWERGRATRTGAVYGAWIGGVGLGAYGALFGAYLDAMDGSESAGAGGALVGAVVGGAIGVFGGGTTGGIVGAAFPRWRLIWGEGSDRLPDPERLAAPETADRGTWTGAIAIAAGVVHSGVDEGLVLDVALTSPLGRRFRHGAEFLMSQAITPELDESVTADDLSYWNQRLLAACWRLEWTPKTGEGGGLEPLLIGGVGSYFWASTYLGVNGGVGLHWRERDGRHAAVLEVRRHVNLQRLTGDDPDITTATLGVSLFW